MRTRIKVCGITTLDDAMLCASRAVDAVGFVFHPGSARHIEPEDAFEIAAALPPFLATVGVFSNVSVEAFMNIEEMCPTTISQLSGDERPEVVTACGPGLIKGIRTGDRAFAQNLARWDSMDEVDAILVNCEEMVDWTTLQSQLATTRKPIILSGVGVSSESVGDAVRCIHPFAVDVCGCVESKDGVKIAALLDRFCSAVRRADSERPESQP